MAETKFSRTYDNSRATLDQIGELGESAVLNTIYDAYPVEFDTPEMRTRILATFRDKRPMPSTFTVNLMRLFCRNPSPKAALCSMPKSGSTFILNGLTQLPEKHRFRPGYLYAPYKNPDIVGALACEHEIDELALLFLEMRSGSWVSHMHTKWTRYTERMLRAHRIRPIVTYRNIFDCIVSMDDMFMRREVDGFSMLRLPARYHDMATDDRLTLLCQFAGPWYVDFAVSWSRAKGEVLRLDYDDDVLGFSEATAKALIAFLKLEGVSTATMMEAFALKDEATKSRVRLNKGISGRGETIPPAAREMVKAMIKPFDGEVDFSRLV
jgi:hypothetical protein